MYLRFEDNPNCGWTDNRVFTERTTPRPIDAVLRLRQGREVWCAITGLDERGQAVPAQACQVDDSGEGLCYLVYGASWGLRLKDPACTHAWSFDDADQWGEPFLLLPSNGADLRFADA